MNEPQETEAQVSGLLGPRDARILDAFMVTGSIPKAAKIIGVDRSTAWRVSKTPGFRDELRRRLDEQARVSRLRLLEHQEPAWTAIGELLESQDERIRAKIAMWVADRGIAEAHLQDRQPVPTVLQLHLESLEQVLLEELTDSDDAKGETDG
ncbi:MAG: hypothetical protein HYU54_05820 [Actinobacteria bacterium]|nr:hypothetical protein [Actinomycetota bacterium]